MSKKRQTDRPRKPAGVIRSLHMRYGAGTKLEAHAHDWAQLVFASEGVMTVRTDEGAWVVPPERALWVPPVVEHSIAMAGRVTMRTLYLAPDLVGDRLPVRPAVVQVSPLIREVILHIVERGMLRWESVADVRLAEVVVDLLAVVPAAPLELRDPRDPRALRAAERLRSGDSWEVSIEALAAAVGASRRTLERLFLRDTGLTLGRWRQQARLLRALEMLAAGDSVTQVAYGVGYQSPSAFIQLFRTHFGTTPGRYYETSSSA